MAASLSEQNRKRERRNITVDPEVDEWLAEEENASQLIEELVRAYRAYGENTRRAAEWAGEKND